MPGDLDALIAEAEGLCVAATAGPWARCDPPWGDRMEIFTGRGDPHGQALIASCNDPFDCNEDHAENWHPEADAAFIARARTLIPELLAALRQRPGREEVERVLREFWGRVQMPVPYDINELSLPTRRRMEADVASALRDLGYGAGDGR